MNKKYEDYIYDTVLTGLTVFCPVCDSRNYPERKQEHVICYKCKAYIQLLNYEYFVSRINVTCK